jgi:nucleoside-diphosphate-sugar epimerase
MAEEALLIGPLEPTNEWYAIAKIADIKLCQAYRKQHGDDFISVMPTNIYGKCNSYHPEYAHVPAALFRRFHEAKLNRTPTVTVWGTGTPKREFLNADDLADACVFLMEYYSGHELINIGSGEEITIASFAGLVAGVVGYKGEIRYDLSKPDGTPRKLLDSSRLKAPRLASEDPVERGPSGCLFGLPPECGILTITKRLCAVRGLKNDEKSCLDNRCYWPGRQPSRRGFAARGPMKFTGSSGDHHP